MITPRRQLLRRWTNPNLSVALLLGVSCVQHNPKSIVSHKISFEANLFELSLEALTFYLAGFLPPWNTWYSVCWNANCRADPPKIRFFPAVSARTLALCSFCLWWSTEKFARWHRGMLEKGVYLAPSVYEAGFMSLAHTEEDVDRTIAIAKEVMAIL